MGLVYLNGRIQMKKVLLITCILGIYLFTGCSQQIPVPTEDEIISKVTEVVPEEVELVNSVTENSTITCYFKCKNRDFTFSVEAFKTKTFSYIPLPDFIRGYESHFYIGYWPTLRHQYLPSIKQSLTDCNLLKTVYDTNEKITIVVLINSEEDITKFVDIIMENEEKIKEELNFIHEPLFNYSVYTTVTKDVAQDISCYTFAPSPELDKETLTNEIKAAINNAGQ